MEITRFKASYVWSETLLELVGGASADAPLQELTKRASYEALVDKLRQGADGPLEATLPWPYTIGHHFWDFYLNERVGGDARGGLAWSKLIPLRARRLIDGADGDWFPGRLVAEGFYYPHGVAVIITAQCQGKFGAKTLANLAAKIARRGKFEVRWREPGIHELALSKLTLDQLANACLAYLRREGFGENITGSRSAPFSIVTVIEATGVDPDQPMANGGEIHQLLDSLANRSSWGKVPPQPSQPGKDTLDISNQGRHDGHIMFAAKRGRAVWLPEFFETDDGPRHTLACFHRNLTLGSMQTESLLNLAAEVERSWGDVAAPSQAVVNQGRSAAGLLGRLHGGEKTFRSWSLRAQIDAFDRVADINALRGRYLMTPLGQPTGRAALLAPGSAAPAVPPAGGSKAGQP